MQFKQYFKEATEPVNSLTENEEKYIDKLADIFYNKKEKEFTNGRPNDSWNYQRYFIEEASELTKEMLMDEESDTPGPGAYAFVNAFIGFDANIKPRFTDELDQLIKPKYSHSPSMYYDKGKVLDQIFYDHSKDEPRSVDKEFVKKIFEICFLNVLNSKEGRIARLKDNPWFVKYFKIRNIPKASQEMFGGMINAI
jgi:hypothetical protein